LTQSRRFLVVDDEEAFARMVQDVAEGCGYETQAARDGRDAQAVTVAFAPSVVMIDMVMPEADGIEYIRWLAGSGFRGRLVLTSGYDQRYLEMAQIIARSSGLGEVEILAKPLRAIQLEAILNRKP